MKKKNSAVDTQVKTIEKEVTRLKTKIAKLYQVELGSVSIDSLTIGLSMFGEETRFIVFDDYLGMAVFPTEQLLLQKQAR